jgi:predicted dehydrogenase
MKKSNKKVINYAVVGLGYFGQTAVLPAFQHAKKNSKLVALISDDPVKLKTLGKKYGVEMRASYDMYEELLKTGEVDAVYIALPNSMHKEYTERAAALGIHVLCEKPMAVTSNDCQSMISSCQDAKVKLMIAYRLHFEKTNLKAIEIVKKGKIGKPRFFNAVFSMQVKAGNIRLNKELGGGTLYDIGIYCINAVRSIFGEEPIEVTALSAKGKEKRFAEVDEMTGVTMRFSDGRLATFTSSFGAADIGKYEVVGTKGSLCVDPAFDFANGLKMELKVGAKIKKMSFEKRDQVAPEIAYFSDCILRNKNPEPSGKEGWADVRIIEALYESARTGKSIILKDVAKVQHPSLEQEAHLPPVDKQPLIHAEMPHP